MDKLATGRSLSSRSDSIRRDRLPPTWLGTWGNCPRTPPESLPLGALRLGGLRRKERGGKKYFEDTLRGWDGVRYVEVDAKLRIIDEYPFPDRERPPTGGRDLGTHPRPRPSACQPKQRFRTAWRAVS